MRPPVGEWGVEEESFFRAPPPPSRPPGGEGGETGGGRAKKIHRRRVRKEEMEAWDMALGDRRHGCPYRNGSQFFEIHSGLGTVAGRASGGERNPQGRETLSFFVVVLRCASVGVMRSGYIDRTYRYVQKRFYFVLSIHYFRPKAALSFLENPLYSVESGLYMGELGRHVRQIVSIQIFPELSSPFRKVG